MVSDMLTLVNTNRMTPPIGPIGLDYIATSARDAGVEVDVVDLCLSVNEEAELENYFAVHTPRLIGLSFRNVDDCFWPSAQWFVPALAEMVGRVKKLSGAPVVLGGVGFSIFANKIVEYTGAEFGIRGDGEQAIVSLYNQLNGAKRFEEIAGLIWREDGMIRSNPPSWPMPLTLSARRDAIDNATYFKRGGQCGLETKRGCNRRCLYCADSLAKGTQSRMRNPSEVADEAESLLGQGIDVIHTCDAEFNIPREHAYAVCEEFNRRGLGEKLSWYTYMAIVPFDAELAEAMRRAGCVGINFTGDSANAAMLKTYRQSHRKEDLATAVRLCKANGMKVMIDLLLGGPGETAETVDETINFIKQINPDCVGAPLGVRIYPGTEMVNVAAGEGELEKNPNIRRKYSGPVDFFKPTFYISEALGQRPAELVKDLIAGDKRFFEPADDEILKDAENKSSKDHNYNDNTELVKAIEQGARGAYWNILRQLRDV